MRTVPKLIAAREATLLKMTVSTLKALIETHRLHCDALIAEFDRAEAFEQKSEIASRWERSIEAKDSAELLLQFIERRKDDPAYTREALRAVQSELVLAYHWTPTHSEKHRIVLHGDDTVKAQPD